MYSCPFCNTIIPTFSQLRYHIFHEHKTENEKCPYCNFLAENWTDLMIHLINSKEKKHVNLLFLLLSDYKEVKADILGG